MNKQDPPTNEQKPAPLLRGAVLVGIAIAAVYLLRGSAPSPKGEQTPMPTQDTSSAGATTKAVNTASLTLPQSHTPSDNPFDQAPIVLHTHTQLSITINGQAQPIPANIGITEQGAYVIHTHDDSGTLHVESPIIRTYTLGDFFTIWGKTFNKQCIFEYCTNDTHTVSVLVDGTGTDKFEYMPLLEGQNIQIIYAARQL